MPWTVLIVDDHQGFRAGARALLEAEGFNVLGEAADGESAVEQARRLRPQVVLLDVQLPGIDGFAVAERLAAEPGRPGGGARLEPGPAGLPREAGGNAGPRVRHEGGVLGRVPDVAAALTAPGAGVDVATGLVLAAAGAVALARGRGPLLLVAGAAWLAGDVWGELVYAHRGPLAHLLLGLSPVTALAYVDGLVPPLARSPSITLALAAAVVLAAAWRSGPLPRPPGAGARRRSPARSPSQAPRRARRSAS